MATRKPLVYVGGEVVEIPVGDEVEQIGEQGPQGEVGPVGPQGPAGIDGEDGAVGPQGPAGQDGVDGATGPKGDTGAGLTIVGSLNEPSELPTVGNEVGHAYLITGNLWVWDGNIWENTGNIQGPVGPVGPVGPEGPQGIQGIQGIQGETGDVGPVGPAGAKGDDGDQGIQGVPGIDGPQGPQGLKGDKGDTGETGPAGPGSGDMLKSENLSGLANVGTARSNIGLGNVDNTADADKPVSTAQATALGLKANNESPAFTGTVTGVTAAMVGLGAVDNTADVDKPVSTAQATAIAFKANLASPAFTGTPTAPTAAPTTSNTQVATTAFTQQEIVSAQALNVLLAGAQTITGAKTFSARSVHSGGAYTPSQQPAFSATPTFDCATGNVFEPAALTANVTAITMTNLVGGQTVQIRFLQDATGGRTVTVPAGAKIDGTQNTDANRVSWLIMTYSARATRWEGNWMVVPA